MNLGFVLGVPRARSSLRRHERWSRAELDRHQAAALAELRKFAVDRSPFYRRVHAGVVDRPLSELPVLTQKRSTLPGLTS